MSAANPNPMQKSMVSVPVVANVGGGGRHCCVVYEPVIVVVIVYSLIPCNLKVMAILQINLNTNKETQTLHLGSYFRSYVWGSVSPFQYVYSPSLVIWSMYPVCTEATTPGSPLSSTLPPPCLSIFPPLFPLHCAVSRPPLPLPFAPLSPAPLTPALVFSSSLHTAPPSLTPLSPFILIGVACPRLPFPSTI
jgi:hypothetical protein